MLQVKNIQTSIWHTAAIKGCAVISTTFMNTEKGNDYADVGVTCD